MIKKPYKIHKLVLSQRGIIWSSYYKYIIDNYFCMWHFRFSNGIVRGPFDLRFKIPENFGKLIDYD